MTVDRLLLLLHLLGSVGMGFYLLLPFLVSRLSGLTGAAQSGYVAGLHKANRIGQYFLILQFLTGGYLVGKGEYSVAWMVLSVVLFLAIAAFAGMMGKPMKRWQQQLAEGKGDSSDGSKVRLFSTLISVLFLVILILMKVPDLV